MFISPGKCFVDLSEEIKDVYAVYCRNHDDAISLMEKVTLIYDNYANKLRKIDTYKIFQTWKSNDSIDLRKV